MSDQILLNNIQVQAYVGVPEKERAHAQLLEISAVLHLDLKAAAQTDRVNQTIDYAAVQQKILEVVRQRPRQLIETVAEDIAQAILGDFKILRVEVEVHKFILENTQSVAVRIVRGDSS